jgi:CPA2 family monovalent cation:H+ antiporter-2
MHASNPLVVDLALTLCVAAATSVVFRALKQPVVLGYLLAGLIVGPHIPIPIFADTTRIQAISDLGVILVMFSIGLELSPRKLTEVLPRAWLVGVVQLSTMMGLGYLLGHALGRTNTESLFFGAILAISSTMVVARVFAETKPRAELRDLVFGVLLLQDLAAILLLTLFSTAFSTGGGAGSAIAQTALELVGFLAAILVGGLLVVPRAVRAIARHSGDETLLIVSLGVCFGFSLLAHEVGFSVALGAFLAGSLVAESGAAKRIEHLVQPMRDVFAALFFVSAGMMLDPFALAERWYEVLLAAVVVVVGQSFSVTLGGFLSGHGVRTSMEAGMTLTQVGEFSFILASTGMAMGVVGPTLYPVTIALSVLTTFTTPWLARAASYVAQWVDRRLPRGLQTLVTLYGAWLEALRARGASGSVRSPIRQHVRALLLDVVVLAGLVTACGLGLPSATAWLERHVGLAETLAGWLIVLAAIAASTPFGLAVVRNARKLGLTLARRALPTVDEGALDRAAAPRGAFVLMLQLTVILVVGAPLLALVQLFVPAHYGGLVLASAVVALVVGFRRAAANLSEHVRAGAMIVAEMLTQQRHEVASTPDLRDTQMLLPGLGALTCVRIEEGSPAIGQTLISLNLRGLTGASVLAIAHKGGQATVPTGRERLATHDVLALTGSAEAISAARAMLCGAQASPRG